jgi:predicted RNA-binding Zn ribbon-like protein
MQRDALPPDLRRRFRGGRPAIDLAHTGGEGEHARWEILHGADDLARYLGVILDLPDVRAADEDLAPARALRAAVDRTARALAAGRAPAGPDVAALNAAAAPPPLVPVLLPGGGTAAVDPADGAAPSAAAALATIARDAVDLFGGPLAHRIRVCAAEDCGLLFVDASRPGRRRWCSMERCGTLAKVRAHRAGRTRPAAD